MDTLYAGLQRTTDATTEPVTGAEVREQMNVSGSESLITRNIKTARIKAEQFMRRALITQSWTMTLDGWPGVAYEDFWQGADPTVPSAAPAYVTMPYPQLQSITSVTTYDQDGDATAVTVDDYFYLDTTSEPGRLCLLAGQGWPYDTRNYAQIVIVYVAGYGDASGDVPEDIRSGIMMHCAWLCEHRGDELNVDGQMGLAASGAMQMYRPSRVIKV